MPNFTHRSTEKELLDGDGIPFLDIKKNMEELDRINHLTGGHKITIQGIKMLLPALLQQKKKIVIAEIGCGGGDNMRVLHKWFNKQQISSSLIGVDINRNCIQFATERNQNVDFTFICADYQTATFVQTPHVIFSSLFCHHFNTAQLILMLQWLYKNSNTGFFINDLHRHSIAYYFIKYATTIFSKSYLVKNDAPLSVLRGFTKKEWQLLLQQAGITQYRIKWQWAFRWLIVVQKSK
jgi:2-polyprenyl-3-methyl-5-hydroxy-6-metoxy-1,4-benzoquinol methylase